MTAWNWRGADGWILARLVQPLPPAIRRAGLIANVLLPIAKRDQHATKANAGLDRRHRRLFHHLPDPVNVIRFVAQSFLVGMGAQLV